MKKQSAAGKPGRNRKKNDPQLREFERRDLGEDIRRSGAARVVRVRAKPTSILLEDDLMSELRKKAAKRGARLPDDAEDDRSRASRRVLTGCSMGRGRMWNPRHAEGLGSAFHDHKDWELRE
jgi:hypothetical protein